MASTHVDDDWIENGLKVLCSALIKSVPANHSQVLEYVEVQEFGLALNLLAHIQLKSGRPASPDTVRMFDALATKMGTKQDDEWQGVAEIRAVL